MKRFLLIGTVFCAAAIIGMGVALLLPADANANTRYCDENERQIWVDCDAVNCLATKQLHAKYDCGTETVGPDHRPCNCLFVACISDCP